MKNSRGESLRPCTTPTCEEKHLDLAPDLTTLMEVVRSSSSARHHELGLETPEAKLISMEDLH